MKGEVMRTKPIKNQRGFASLVIAVTLIIILSLLTVGFAELSRNEVKQTTNRQLSSQAYYAAESGVNDAVRAITDGFNEKKDTCPPYGTAPSPSASTQGEKDLADNTVVSSSGATVEWTCLLINPSPTDLEFSSVSTTKPRTFKTWSDSNITSMTFYWQDAAAGVTGFQTINGASSSNNTFPKLTTWQANINPGGNGATGLLRVALTPLSDTSRAGLIANTYTVYMYPTTASGNTTTYAPDKSTTGVVVNGNCSTANVGAPNNWPKYCSVTINGLNITAGTPLLVDLRSIYSATDIQITANNGAADLLGVQTQVDSTGRDQDVLKRIRVAVPNTQEYTYPGYTLDSLNGVCKQLSVYPGSASGCSY